HGGEIGPGKRVVPISPTVDTARCGEVDALLGAASLPDPKLTVPLHAAHRHLKAIAYTPAGEAALQTAGIAGGFDGIQTASGLATAFALRAEALPEHRVWSRAAQLAS